MAVLKTKPPRKIFCFFSFSIFESGAFHLILALGGVHQAAHYAAHASNVIPTAFPSLLPLKFFPLLFSRPPADPAPLDFKQQTQPQQRCAWAFGTSEIFSIFCWCVPP